MVTHDTGACNALDAALGYAELGYPVLPIEIGGKTPLTKHGKNDATTGEATIREWFARWPLANVAIATEGLLVVDIDDSESPWLDDTRGTDLARAPTAETPRGGRHHVFAQPDGINLRNTAGKLAERVDTRADGGYFVVAPSRTEEGAYRWLPGHELVARDDLPQVTTWLLEELAPTNENERKRTRPGTIPAGQRNDRLFRFASSLRGRGLGEAEILAALRERNEGYCRPPLDNAELEKIVESAGRYEPDDDGETLSNHVMVEVVGGDGNVSYRPDRIPLGDIVDDLLELAAGFPKRLGDELLVEDDERIRWLPKEDDVFAWLHGLAEIRWRSGRDRLGRNLVTRREFVSALRARSEIVDEATDVPFEPPAPRVFVTSRFDASEGDPSIIWDYLRRFCPATQLDAALIEALCLTPFWGGAPGKRPVFVVTGCDGVGEQELGKTSLVDLVTAPAGGPCRIQTGRRHDTIAKQLLDDAALPHRVALIDNADGLLANRELAEIVTAPVIEGRPAYGKRRRRANRVTWCVTAVSPSLSTDLARRSFVIQLTKPPEYPGFETDARAFLEKHRGDLVAAAVAKLGGEKVRVTAPHSRFPEWDDGVLACSPEVNRVLAARAEKIDVVDEEGESIARFVAELRRRYPQLTEVTPAELAKVWHDANRREIDTGWLVRRLKAAAARGKLPAGLTLARPNSHGSPWRINPSELDEEA